MTNWKEGKRNRVEKGRDRKVKQKEERQKKHNKAKQKNMCASGYMLLTIRVGRSDYFFIFCNNFICLKYVLIKTELLYLHFQSIAWCHGPLLLYFQWLTV